jgi:hypothetical protein
VSVAARGESMETGILRSLAVLAICAVMAPAVAIGAPKRARLTIEVKIEGTEKVVGAGADQTGSKFREGYTLVTYLRADGDLEQFNPKDPQYAQKMMGLSRSVQSRADKARGKTPAKKMTQQQIQEYVQKKQVACAAEQSCLMKLAAEVQELMANMDTGASADSSPAYTGDEPPRFLSYIGFDHCGAKVHTYVDRTITGTLADTTGAVPYTIKETVDYDNNPTELGLICNLHQAVLDTQDASIYTDGAIAPHYKGTSVMTSRGKTTQSTATEFGHGEPMTWINEQLRHAPRSGHRTTTLKLTQNQGAAIHSGKFSGQAAVDLTWRFEDAN